MCVGNRADDATFWINEQLKALWTLSQNCVATQITGLKPSKTESLLSSSLARLWVGTHRSKASNDDLRFFGSFEAPTFKFICNHDVLLILKVKSGHFKLDNKDFPRQFEDYTCTFRIPFRVHVITDEHVSSAGTTKGRKARFLLLDYSGAEVVRELSGFADMGKLSFEEISTRQRAINNHLRTDYLPLLRQAGFNFFQSLPDFDKLASTHLIDWSAIYKSVVDVATFHKVNIDVTTIHGVSIDVINTSLKSRWLEAAWAADELMYDYTSLNPGVAALAEHDTTIDGFNFHLLFGPPQIHGVCSQEVVFMIDIQEAHASSTSDPTKHFYTNWKIAIVAELLLVVEDEGRVRRLRLDFSANKARFSKSMTSFGIDDMTLHPKFIDYICTRYLYILAEFGFDYIYVFDDRFIDDGFEEAEFSEDEYKEHVSITETHGYDVLTAITQASINHNLRSLWKASQSEKGLWWSWKLKDKFEALFDAPQIQLPGDSSSKAYIFVSLKEGLLKDLQHGNTKDDHEFLRWRLAFEVELKLVQSTKLETDAVSDDHLKAYCGTGDYVRNQLILDFTTARFRHDLSRFPGLFDDMDYHLMRLKCRELVHCMRDRYFKELIENHHHVLYTVPVWAPAHSCGRKHLAMTSLYFQTYASDTTGTISILFGDRRSLGNRNMIVVFGMINSTRPASFPLPPCNWTWRFGATAFTGTIALSRSVFLDALLLELKEVNRATTLIPKLRGIDEFNQEWFSLLTLSSAEEIAKKTGEKWSGRCCDWEPVVSSKHPLEFIHQNNEEWTYHFEGHSGDHVDRSGSYSISCNTRNSLFAPTISANGACEITLKGEIQLVMRYTGGQKSWSTEATSGWSSVISFKEGAPGRGLSITLRDSPPKFSKNVGFSGNYDVIGSGMRDAATLLQSKFQNMKIDLVATIKYLENTFGNVWHLFYSGAYGYTLRSPAFNSHGDLTFGLESPLDVEGKLIGAGSASSIAYVLRPGQTVYRPKLLEIGQALSAGPNPSSVKPSGDSTKPEPFKQVLPPPPTLSIPKEITTSAGDNLSSSLSTAVNTPLAAAPIGNEKSQGYTQATLANEKAFPESAVASANTTGVSGVDPSIMTLVSPSSKTLPDLKDPLLDGSLLGHGHGNGNGYGIANVDPSKHFDPAEFVSNSTIHSDPPSIESIEGDDRLF